MTSLTKVKLTGNKLYEFPNFYPVQATLKNIWLSENSITIIPDLPPLAISMLYMTDNNITFEQSDKFVINKELSTLGMRDNPLKYLTLTLEDHEVSSNLKILNLQDSHLIQFPNVHPVIAAGLQTLRLTSNKIRAISN